MSFRSRIILLCAGSALSTATVLPALAQGTGGSSTDGVTTTRKAATRAHGHKVAPRGVHHAALRRAAVAAPAAIAAPPRVELAPPRPRQSSEEITVTAQQQRYRQPGGGLLRVETATKAVQTVTRDYISKQPPTANIQTLLQMLPSANVSLQDPFGLYNGQVQIRGLDQSEVGWLVDGLPLNSIGGGQFYANEVLESEDLQEVSLQPGSVNLDSPIVSGAGGLVTATMLDPTHKFGGLLDVSAGSFNTFREFLRVNSGDLGRSGLRAFFSFSHTSAHNWRGYGNAEKFHYDFKAVEDWTPDSHTSLTVSYNDQVNDSFLNPNLTQYRTQGYSANWTPYYMPGSAGVNFYALHVNPFRNVIASSQTHLKITPKLSIDDSIYFWHGIGNGTGASYLTEGSTYLGGQKVNVDLNGDGAIHPATKVVALTPSNEEQFRPGNTIKANYQIDHHNQITLGWWYEYANLLQFSPVGKVNQQTGEPYNIWGVDALYTLPNGADYKYRNFSNLSQINMIFIGDSADYFNRKLHIDLGFKEAMVTRRLYNYVGPLYNTNLHTAEPLPQLGASWAFDAHNQIYVSVATNFKTPTNVSLIDYYSNTSTARTQVAARNAPEYAISEEIGYRYNGELLVGSVSFFNYNFTNRLITTNNYINGAIVSTSVNAGGQTSRGADLQLATRPFHHIRPYIGFEYLDAKIDNNIASTGTLNGRTITDYLPTTGKTQVRSPHEMASLGLDYDDGNLFASVDLHYTGKQYATFMNDNEIKEYISNDLNIGYRFANLGRLQTPTIQISMQNLTNAKFRNGIAGTQNNAAAQKGVFGSTISGASPTYYLQPPFTAIVTLTTGF